MSLQAKPHLCACRDCQGTSHGVRPAWWPEGLAFGPDLWPNSFSVPVHEVIVSPLLCTPGPKRSVLTVMLELAEEGDSRQVGGGWEGKGFEDCDNLDWEFNQ